MLTEQEAEQFYGDTGPADPGKPVMSEQEASWHETMAGLRASQAAAAEGAAPSAIDALLAASVREENRIGPVVLKRATKGTALTLNLLAGAFAEWVEGKGIPAADRDMLEDGIATIVFMDSEAAYVRFRRDGIGPFIVDAERLVWSLDLETVAAINGHVMEQMQRLQALSNNLNGGADDAPGKPGPATDAGASPAMPEARREKTSPPASGSWPNTDSPSTTPSGASPSPQPSSCCRPATNGTAETRAQATPRTQPSPQGTGAGDGSGSISS